MSLVKGNMDSLLGRVIFYAINDSKSLESTQDNYYPKKGVQNGVSRNLMAWYCTSNPEEIARMVDVPLDFVIEKMKKERQSMAEIYDGYPTQKIIVLPYIPIEPDSIEEIMNSEYDVVNSGVHLNEQYCIQSLRRDNLKYRLLFEEQVNSAFTLRFPDIKRAQTFKYVQNSFVNRMILSMQEKSKREFDEYEFGLFRFSEHSNFEEAAVDLSLAIKENPKDTPFIYTHIMLIHALNNQFSGQVKEYQSMIEEMKNIKQKRLLQG